MNESTPIVELQTLAQSLKLSAGKHILNNTWFVLLSIICVLLGISSIVFLFLMKNIWPFFIINELRHSQNLLELGFNKADVNIFSLVVKGMILLFGILFLYLGLLFNNLRIKNNIIQSAGKKIGLHLGILEKEIAANKPIELLHKLEEKDLSFLEEGDNS
jgi:hypothetical protein